MSESRIYTKLGDDGSTGLLFGGRTSKGNLLLDAVGSVDEAVAALGVARAASTDPDLGDLVLQTQRDLFVVAADLSTNPHARERLVPEVSLVTAAMTTRVEALIDRLVTERPLRPVFVVPGASSASAALDLARTIVRRAERRLVAHLDQDGAEAPPVNRHVRSYLNRVSDLLFVLARRAAGDEEPVSHD